MPERTSATRRDARLRLFVAASVPHELLVSVAHAAEGLKERWPAARWSDVANQHVTLKFLGWADESLLRGVRERCAEVARGHEPALLTLDDLDAFPSRRRVRVVWVGLDDPAGLLAGLAADLDRALEPLGFESESRAYTPHLTLARLRDPVRDTGEWPTLDVPRTPWTCGEIVLFRSHLSPRGARYEPLESFALGR